MCLEVLHLKSIAIKPPESVKKELFKKISANPRLTLKQTENPEETPIKKIITNYYKYGMIASIALLIGLFAYNFYQNNNISQL